MTLDTFFKTFDQFAAAPDAVAKMRNFFSTNGAFHDSLGQRPRTNAPHIPQALKGRPTR
jgi:hypothetical protein